MEAGLVAPLLITVTLVSIIVGLGGLLIGLYVGIFRSDSVPRDPDDVQPAPLKGFESGQSRTQLIITQPSSTQRGDEFLSASERLAECVLLGVIGLVGLQVMRDPGTAVFGVGPDVLSFVFGFILFGTMGCAALSCGAYTLSSLYGSTPRFARREEDAEWRISPTQAILLMLFDQPEIRGER